MSRLPTKKTGLDGPSPQKIPSRRPAHFGIPLAGGRQPPGEQPLKPSVASYSSLPRSALLADNTASQATYHDPSNHGKTYGEYDDQYQNRGDGELRFGDRVRIIAIRIVAKI